MKVKCYVCMLEKLSRARETMWQRRRSGPDLPESQYIDGFSIIVRVTLGAYTLTHL